MIFSLLFSGTPNECDIQYKRIEDILTEFVQDPYLQNAMEYDSCPLYDMEAETRVFGPFSSGLHWEEQEIIHGGKKVLCVIAYSDATEFYRNCSAHPVFSK